MKQPTPFEIVCPDCRDRIHVDLSFLDALLPTAAFALLAVVIGGVWAYFKFGILAIPVAGIALCIAYVGFEFLTGVMIFSFAKLSIRPNVPEQQNLNPTRVSLDNGSEAIMPFPAKESFSKNGVHIFVLDLPLDVPFTENVFAADEDGTLIWQIERHAFTNSSLHHYVGFIQPEDGDETIWIANFNGTQVNTCIYTGKITETRLRR